ncbi:MAG: hypothetical protein U0470_00210 [Anaerolineae bacterium]
MIGGIRFASPAAAAARASSAPARGGGVAARADGVHGGGAFGAERLVDAQDGRR